MNRIILPFVAITAGMFLIFTSCDRNSTVGAVGDPMEGDFPEFDTFRAPETKYYFYGRFDGNYKTWADSMRSKWDTATRICLDPDMDWSQCPVYTDNIYYNLVGSGVVIDTCSFQDPKDGSVFYRIQTRFLRPEIASERIELFFYDCVNLDDMTNPNYPINQFDILRVGAYPFTNPSYARDGVEVVYTDAFREKWRTKPGSGQSLDTYFRLTDLQPLTPADSLDSLALFVAEGEFAGRLFNDESGDELILNEAKFRVRLIADTSDMVP